MEIWNANVLFDLETFGPSPGGYTTSLIGAPLWILRRRNSLRVVDRSAFRRPVTWPFMAARTVFPAQRCETFVHRLQQVIGNDPAITPATTPPPRTWRRNDARCELTHAGPTESQSSK